MDFEMAVVIEAPPERVWSTLADLERWPEWSDSITSVERLNGQLLTVGATVRIKQPHMAALVWEVREIETGQAFSWSNMTLGVTTLGTHRIRPLPGQRSEVGLGVRQTGALAPILGLFTSRRTRRYVQMEAAGLKRRCESA
jgi:uncharacterized membrane protein